MKLKKVVFQFALLGWGGLVAATPGLAADKSCFTLVKEQANNNFVLVVDRSGSMSGNPIRQAKAGLKAFVQGMGSDDQVALVSFDNKVKVELDFTSDHAALDKAIDQIRLDGNTALYDGVAKAVQMLTQTKGKRTILYLTDGADNASSFTIEDIRKMNQSEGILLMGIGLGQVEVGKLTELQQATKGFFQHVHKEDELKSIYLTAQETYRKRYADPDQKSGNAVLKSLPDGLPVLVDDNDTQNTTPYKASRLQPGTHKFAVSFGNFKWQCQAPIKAGHTTVMNAREDELGGDIVFLAQEPGTAVFVDGAYVGLTGTALKYKPDSKQWSQRALKDATQLRAENVKMGKHVITLRGMPDFNFGPEQELQLDIEVKYPEMVIYAEILQRKAVDSLGYEHKGKELYKKALSNPTLEELQKDPNSIFDGFEEMNKGFSN